MNVEDQVIGLVRLYLYDEDKATPESRFIDDLGFDSLDVVELMCDLEEEFGMDIPDEDTEKWVTVGDVISYVAERIVD